jgi:hypothetical protein
MRKLTIAILTLALASAIALAQRAPKQDEVEIEKMTYPEIYSAIHDRGKTTVLIYNGGTEQRGPHAILGRHTLMARSIAPMIARQLGNAYYDVDERLDIRYSSCRSSVKSPSLGDSRGSVEPGDRYRCKHSEGRSP